VRIAHRSTLRRSLSKACFEAPASTRAAPRVWSERELLAGHIKWLDMYDHLDMKSIARRLGTEYQFVYSVLERAYFAQVPEIEPPKEQPCASPPPQ
jgi:hypothetical protein